MSVDAATIAALAERLDRAQLTRTPIRKITDDHPDLDWHDAYAIQDALRVRKLARGAAVAGLKMGLTSQVKMRQMGVSEPICGVLFDDGVCMDGGAVERARFIHPRVEAEIAVVTRAPLAGPGCDIAAVLAAVDFVLPAMEIIDSRYEQFGFDLKSVIADNTSSAGFVTGGRARAVGDIDLRTIGVVLEKNGAVVEVGAGAAVLGHPALSVAMLANLLAERGAHIPAGTFIMTGGITAAIAVEAGDHVSARYQDLGSLSVRFV